MSPAARSRLVLVAALLAIVVGVSLYVTRRADNDVAVQVGGAAADSFSPQRALATAGRALFSPDGAHLAVVDSAGVGLADRGRVRLIPVEGLDAVDVAWMPTSRALLVLEGPTAITELRVLGIDGVTVGTAKLSHPITAGAGHGVTVDGRGARAVVATEARDPIGGRRRLDLVLVDLTTGAVTPVTETPEIDESRPMFLGDDRIMFTATTDGRSRVLTRDLAARTDRPLSAAGEEATAVGVLRGHVPVFTATQDDRTALVALDAAGRRHRLGGVPADSTVWTVDPAGTTAVVTSRADPDVGRPPVNIVRAVTLTPPSPL